MAFIYPVAAAEYSSLIDSLSIIPPPLPHHQRPPFLFSPSSTLTSPFSRVCLPFTSIIGLSRLHPHSLECLFPKPSFTHDNCVNQPATVYAPASPTHVRDAYLEHSLAGSNARAGCAAVTAFDGLLTRRSLWVPPQSCNECR